MFKSALFTAGLLAASAVAQVMVNTPSNVVVCKPVQITWTGGTPPFTLSLIAQGTTSPAVESYDVTSSPFVYTTHLAVGTNVFVNVLDSTGVTGQTAPFSILTGPDTSCIGQPYTSTTGSTGTTAPTTPGSTTTPGAPGTTAPTSTGTTTAGNNPATTSKPTTTAATTGSANTTSKTGNSAPTQAAMGVAGVIGAAVMAILV